MAAVFTVKNPDSDEMERFVYVQQGENFEKKNVKVGVSDYFFAEIQEGVAEGDIVALELPKEEREKKAQQTAHHKSSNGRKNAEVPKSSLLVAKPTDSTNVPATGVSSPENSTKTDSTARATNGKPENSTTR